MSTPGSMPSSTELQRRRKRSKSTTRPSASSGSSVRQQHGEEQQRHRCVSLSLFRDRRPSFQRRNRSSSPPYIVLRSCSTVPPQVALTPVLEPPGLYSEPKALTLSTSIHPFSTFLAGVVTNSELAGRGPKLTTPCTTLWPSLCPGALEVGRTFLVPQNDRLWRAIEPL